jgi:hypothetical protein
MQKQAVPGIFAPTSRSGWITFAGTMTLVTGGLNALDGLIGLYRTSYFRDLFVFGNLRAWAIAWVVFGAIQLLAGFAILGRQGWGRWFALATVSINAFIQLLTFSAAPFWSLAIIAYDVAIFYALSVHWQRRISA